MKFEFKVSQDDMYGCYKAFFSPKNTKFNEFFKWFMLSLNVLLVIYFFVMLGIKEYDLLLPTGIMILAFGILTVIGFFNKPFLKIFSKRNFKKSHLEESDRVKIEIEGGKYKEEIYSGDKTISNITYDLRNISRLEEDNDNFYIMFGLGSASIIKKHDINHQTLVELGRLLFNGLESKPRKKNKDQKPEEAKEDLEIKVAEEIKLEKDSGKKASKK